jgi:DNA polymerase-3 subunit epsilon
MRFVAIDVETANADVGSICQVGTARYEDGTLREQWKSLVDPQDYFHPINVSIHGISRTAVRGAPRFAELAERLYATLDGTTAVSHTQFDRVALGRAFEHCGLREPCCEWLDTAEIAQETWSAVTDTGYRLEQLCAMIGYQYRAHDALEDAKAAAQVLLAAMNGTPLDVSARVERVNPLHRLYGSPAAREGNPNGVLWGEVAVFTGALSIPRPEAADIASELGIKVANSVTKKTTILIVGEQDPDVLAGHDKSTKHRKAEELIAKGQSIRVLSESDFRRLVGLK